MPRIHSKMHFKASSFSILLCFFSLILQAQVGIGTVTPDISAALEVASTTQGMLTPRMTTIQRTGMAAPANGLIVYDTDLNAFHYYDNAISSWIKMHGDKEGRLKFKRIKSTDVLAKVLAPEKTAGGNTKYLLDPTTLYEINGAVTVDFPIELNNAYIIGLDTSEDKLIKISGDLFTGTTGGSIRVVTLVAAAGRVFNISGGGTQSLIFRDAIVANSSSVGIIDNFSLVFISIVQYAGNTTGIVYKDISKLLLTNVGWFGTNIGTYETLQGTFGLVGKIGGFSEVNGTSIGFDVSSNPTITGDAVLETVVFTGTNTAGYVKGYTPAVYAGYNFDNRWSVRCPGIPTEMDAYATGNIYDSNNTTSSRTTATVLNQDYKVVTNATAATNLFKVTSGTTGRLTYVGKKPRTFQVNATVSFVELSGGNNTNYVFYIAKIGTNGTTVTPLPATETFIDTNGGFVQSFPITGTVQLSTNESVEVHLKRITNPASPKINIDVYSLNMAIK